MKVRGVCHIVDNKRRSVLDLSLFFPTDDEHDYNTECMNNAVIHQGWQQHRQCAEIKTQKEQDSQSNPKPLTKMPPLLTSQVEMS